MLFCAHFVFYYNNVVPVKCQTKALERLGMEVDLDFSLVRSVAELKVLLSFASK